jgi:hypothetical protein
MPDVVEAIQGLLSLVITLFVVAIILIALRGGDVTPIATLFADILPGIIVGFLIIYLIAVVVQ